MNEFEQFVSSYFRTLESKDISIETGIKLFLQHVKINNSPETYKYYKSTLKYICIFFKTKNIERFSQINYILLDEYVIYESNRGVCNNSINKRIGAIKTCSSYLSSKKVQALDHSIEYDKLPPEKKEIEIVSDENFLKIYNYLECLSLRDKVIALLIMQTGVRRTECCHILKRYTYVEENKIFLYHTKTNSPRYIFFDNETALLIKELMKQNDSIYLFGEDDKPLSPNIITHIFEKIKKDLKIPKSISPHKFRHTFATKVLSTGGNLEDVRVLLGHSSYDMTKNYLHLIPDQIKNTSLQHNPLFLLKSR